MQDAIDHIHRIGGQHDTIGDGGEEKWHKGWAAWGVRGSVSRCNARAHLLVNLKGPTAALRCRRIFLVCCAH